MTVENKENEVVETQPTTEATPDKEVVALKNKNAELLDDLAKLKQFRKSVDELGGLDTIKEIVQSTKQAKQAEVEASGDIDAVKKQYQDEIANLQSNIESLQKSMVDTQVTAKMKQAVSDAGGTWELVEPAIKKRVNAEFVDAGNVDLTVLDDNGNQWIKDGKDASITDLVEQLRQDPIYTKAFDNQVTRTGSGAMGSKRKPAHNPWLTDNPSLDEQTKIWMDNPDKARRLMKEAGVSAGTRR